MIGMNYDPFITPNELVVRQRVKPMPSRQELLKRCSFPSVNDNRYLTAILKGKGK